LANGLAVALCLGAGNSSTNLGDAMTTSKLNKLAMVVGTTVLAMATATAQSTQAQAKADAPAAPKRFIVVSLEDRKLALVEDGQVSKVYTVAVGKPSTPSPVGTFTIQRRAINPTYSHNGRTVPPGPANPVGTRWMGLSIRGYGIHGTNEPNSIGKAASHGCIRMAKADLEEFYAMVAVGDTVQLVGERNAETAQLFDTRPNPAASSVQLALAAKSVPQVDEPATLTPVIVDAISPVAIVVASL
jgi:lipoprotein-anchoring transpeptidase ErfK/SrfK